MRNISAGNLALIQARRIVARDFLWLKARAIGTGVPFNYGFWSGVGDVQVQVVNPDTGLANTRNFEGSGSLIQISDIPLVANITVQQVSISMSQLDPGVENIVRGYDLKQAGVEIYRGLFDVASRELLVPALCRFVGFVDSVTINTPEENGDGGIELACVSHTQEMTRANPDTRSNDSQKRRSATDNFFQDVTTVGETEFFWGAKQGKITTKASNRLNTAIVLRGM
ncbi:hypothetical protein [Phyllobacterium lublinensis]|uniref:hypothetical protein n=1 Tax=Phyllobacterium lublinensis TaxID=2875708 RepID=UPI001CC9361F|nr:hypothetical protein [Phyllobacterium sp. 2063]MBZ9653552.1 hypothetical protein [Phyllobacterium sp. 2063]